MILLIFLLVGSNIAWIYYENQFEDSITTTTIDATQEGSGNNTVVGGDYGTKSENHKDN